MSTRWYSVAQVADMRSLTPDYVRHLIRARVLGASTTNPLAARRTYRVSEHHLRAYDRATERRAA